MLHKMCSQKVHRMQGGNNAYLDHELELVISKMRSPCSRKIADDDSMADQADELS